MHRIEHNQNIFLIRRSVSYFRKGFCLLIHKMPGSLATFLRSFRCIMSLLLFEELTFTIVSHREILHELGIN